MEVLGILVVIGVIAFIVYKVKVGARSFDDPRPMSNEHLVSAIAGQAAWLEKMRLSPLQAQQSASIRELAKARRQYVAQLCLEAISRASRATGLAYPGGAAFSPFSETAEYAQELEKTGLSKEIAAVRAVKEKLFTNNGYAYPASWE